MGTQPRGARWGGPPTMVTVVVILALLAPLVAPIAGGDLWGWLPDHGHASVTGHPGAHTHPWDAASSVAETPGEVGLVFTAGDLLGAPAVPVSLVVLIAIPILVGGAVTSPRPGLVRAPLAAPEPPPPR